MAGTSVMCGILMNRNSVLKMRLQRASSPLPKKDTTRSLQPGRELSLDYAGALIADF